MQLTRRISLLVVLSLLTSVAMAYAEFAWVLAARGKNCVDEQNRASTALAERITGLNVWLLRVTVAIGALTFVQLVLTGLQVVVALKGR